LNGAEFEAAAAKLDAGDFSAVVIVADQKVTKN
jgi:hypothetical protein